MHLWTGRKGFTRVLVLRELQGLGKRGLFFVVHRTVLAWFLGAYELAFIRTRAWCNPFCSDQEPGP